MTKYYPTIANQLPARKKGGSLVPALSNPKSVRSRSEASPVLIPASLSNWRKHTVFLPTPETSWFTSISKGMNGNVSILRYQVYRMVFSCICRSGLSLRISWLYVSHLQLR